MLYLRNRTRMHEGEQMLLDIQRHHYIPVPVDENDDDDAQEM